MEDTTMKMLSKKRKKNNKGFSLVELIVVVLIIAIIAVALAPQVMKWVGKAKTNVDKNNEASIKSAIQIALTELESEGKTLKNSVVKFLKSGDIVTVNVTVTPEDNDYGIALKKKIEEVFGGSYPTPSDGLKYFEVEIDVSSGVLDKITVTKPTPTPTS